MPKRLSVFIVIVITMALYFPLSSYADEGTSQIATASLEETQIGDITVGEDVSVAETMTTLYLDKGPITLGSTSISGYDQNGVLITALNPEGYLITQTDSTISINKTITITGGMHDIVLGGINVDVSSLRYLTAISIKAGATTHITLDAGTVNSLKSSQNKAGLQVQAGAVLTLDGEGTLYAYGGAGLGAAAIGGAASDNGCGTIIINGGIIYAYAASGSSCPGIGEGTKDGDTGIIEINGGTVTAVGATKAAGIGGSVVSSVMSITVNGGVVNATGGGDGAGVSVGRIDAATSSLNAIYITGGSVIAIGGSRGAGIGGCGNAHGVGYYGGIIQISGGVVIAQGGLYAAAIGSGSGTIASSNTGSITIITGGTIFATRGSGARDIGNSYLNTTAEGPLNRVEINGGNIKAANDSIYPAPRNGSTTSSDLVYRTTVHLVDEITSTELSGVNSIIDSDYNFNGVATDNGYIYMYLPASSSTYACLKDISGYHGTIDTGGDSWLKLDQSAFRIRADLIDITSCQLDKPLGSVISLDTTGGNGTGSVSYSSSDTNVGSLSGSNLSLLTEGTTTITANKVATDDSYYDASASFDLNVTGPLLTGAVSMDGLFEPLHLITTALTGVQCDIVPSYYWVRVGCDDSETSLSCESSSYEIVAEDVGGRIRIYLSDASGRYDGSLVATSDIISSLTIDVSVPTSLDIAVSGTGEFNVPLTQIENYSLCDVYLTEVNISWNEEVGGAGDIFYCTGDVTWLLTLGEAGGATTYTFLGNDLSESILFEHGFIPASIDGITPVGMTLPWAFSLREGGSIKYSPYPVNIATITYTVNPMAPYA